MGRTALRLQRHLAPRCGATGLWIATLPSTGPVPPSSPSTLQRGGAGVRQSGGCWRAVGGSRWRCGRGDPGGRPTRGCRSTPGSPPCRRRPPCTGAGAVGAGLSARSSGHGQRDGRGPSSDIQSIAGCENNVGVNQVCVFRLNDIHRCLNR